MMAKNQTIRNFSCSAQTVTWNSSGEYPKKIVAIAAVKYKNERLLRASQLNQQHMLVAFSNGFFFPSGGGPPKTNATMERKAMTAERSRTPLGNPLFWMRKVIANGNARPANLWLVTIHACQLYLEGAKFMLTCRGPSRCYAHSEVFISWKPLIVLAKSLRGKINMAII